MGEDFVGAVEGLVTLNWDKSLQTDIDSYRVYKNAATGSTCKLLAANLYWPNKITIELMTSRSFN